MAAMLPALRAGRLLPQGRFMILISVIGWVAVGRIRSSKKSNDLIGNRTLDLPACSIVLDPTTLYQTTWRTSSQRYLSSKCEISECVLSHILSAVCSKISNPVSRKFMLMDTVCSITKMTLFLVRMPVIPLFHYIVRNKLPLSSFLHHLKSLPELANCRVDRFLDAPFNGTTGS
jgi:hypothetical protein